MVFLNFVFCCIGGLLGRWLRFGVCSDRAGGSHLKEKKKDLNWKGFDHRFLLFTEHLSSVPQ